MHRQRFPYLGALLLLYGVCHGSILLYSRGLPYVMDANESFSVFWHAYNLLHFNIAESFGLTDESYGPSAAAHPYVHTHQGNMPRLFGALIYALGADTVEAQIVVTTLVIGTATVVFAFFAMRRLSNSMFALVFCALLVTDYLQFAQWNVVTYRVWYGFLFFAILLSIMRAGEPRGRWAMAGLFGSFVLLFYNELVFAGLTAIIAALFTGYWYRDRTRLAMRLWSIEVAGAATAVTILLAQLIGKFGLSVVKQDFTKTFLLRNLSSNVDQQNASMEFFKEHGIVFWPNFVSDSPYGKGLFSFFKVQMTFIFQLYTPWLTLLMVILLCGFLFALAIDRRFLADCRSWVLTFRPLTLFLRKPWFAGMVLLTAIAAPVGPTSRSLDVAFGILGGIAAARVISIWIANAYLLRLKSAVVALRVSDAGVVIQVFAWAAAAFFIFWRPASFAPASRIALACAVCVICLVVYSQPPQFASSVRVWLKAMNVRRASLALWIPPRFVASVRAWLKAINVRRASLALWFPTLVLPAALGVAFFMLLICIALEARVFGIGSSKTLYVPLEYGSAAALLGSLATAAAVLILGRRYRDGAAVAATRLLLYRVGLFIVFISAIAFFVCYQWKVYDQDFAPLWMEFVSFPGGTKLARLFVLASVLLAGALILFGWRRFLRTTEAKALVGPVVLLILGEIAFFLIFFVSRGYVMSGYLLRTAPFAVFFTSVCIAATFFVLGSIGWRTARSVHRLACSQRLQGMRLGFGLGRSRLVAGIISIALLGALAVYWVGLQGGYLRMLPPDHFAVLQELRKPPFYGQSSVLNTYAAPAAAMTGQWAYFDGIYFMNRIHRTESGYVVERDLRNYLWLADRDVNPDYLRPQLFICLWQQSLRNVVADLGKGFQDFHNYCPRLPIVAAAVTGTGPMQHKLLAADRSPRGSWAIIQLDHELPPIANDVVATLVGSGNRLSATVAYRYLQQDGTPEGQTIVELVGDPAAKGCDIGGKPTILASGGPGDRLEIPRGFSGAIAIRVTPVSRRKTGEQVTSNAFRVSPSGGFQSCPYSRWVDFAALSRKSNDS